jgi:chromosome segregation ATPase
MSETNPRPADTIATLEERRDELTEQLEAARSDAEAARDAFIDSEADEGDVEAARRRVETLEEAAAEVDRRIDEAQAEKARREAEREREETCRELATLAGEAADADRARREHFAAAVEALREHVAALAEATARQREACKAFREEAASVMPTGPNDYNQQQTTRNDRGTAVNTLRIHPGVAAVLDEIREAGAQLEAFDPGDLDSIHANPGDRCDLWGRGDGRLPDRGDLGRRVEDLALERLDDDYRIPLNRFHSSTDNPKSQ